MTYHDSLLRQFLLGELDEPARSRLELDLLEDQSLFEKVESIDGELLLELSRGELTERQAGQGLKLVSQIFQSPSGPARTTLGIASGAMVS